MGRETLHCRRTDSVPIARQAAWTHPPPARYHPHRDITRIKGIPRNETQSSRTPTTPTSAICESFYLHFESQSFSCYRLSSISLSVRHSPRVQIEHCSSKKATVGLYDAWLSPALVTYRVAPKPNPV